MVRGCVVLFVGLAHVNAIAILIVGITGVVAPSLSLTFDFFPGVSSDVRVTAQRLGDTGDCGSAEVSDRFAADGGVVSVSGCRCGSFSPRFRGSGGCFGSLWVCILVCFVALK